MLLAAAAAAEPAAAGGSRRSSLLEVVMMTAGRARSLVQLLETWLYVVHSRVACFVPVLRMHGATVHCVLEGGCCLARQRPFVRLAYRRPARCSAWDAERVSMLQASHACTAPVARDVDHVSLVTYKC